jgi:VWFA-related protein
VSQLTRLIALSIVVLLGQMPQRPQQPAPIRGGTNLVRVDVFATKSGTPVQDLTAADFNVFENNTPQTITSFEHIVVEPAPQAERAEPNSVSAANQLAADPHRRVFVIFLDTKQVDVAGSHDIAGPLIDFMTRVMGADDLVGVMTPEMSADQITFGRRTDVIEEQLRKHWAWGQRDGLLLDQRETMYEQCFPPADNNDTTPSRLAKQLIARRRERIALDSLQDLVRHMEGLREGRTAVVTISDGWLLYGPDQTLTNLRKDAQGRPVDPVPGAPPPVGVSPGGTLTTRLTNEGFASDRTECEKDQMDLAMADNGRYFKDIYEEANRANVSFYTIDPRGLVVFDSSIGPDTPPPPSQDLVNLRNRHEALRTLSLNTDGLALLDSNDLKKQMRRMADDLTSYYLIGYSSTNNKLDGSYRTIRVQSKRPGIEIRARHGYRAATQAEADAARAAADVAIPEEKAAVTRAIGTIEGDARAQGRTAKRADGEPLVFHRGPTTGNQLQPAAGKIFSRSDRVHVELEAAAGAPVWSAALLDRNGNRTVIPVATSERTDAGSGQRWLTADVTLAPLGAGDYVLELTTTAGSEQKRMLVPIRVTS